MTLNKGWLVAPLLLAGCSSESDEAEEKIDYSTFDDAAVEALYADAQYEMVLEVVRGQEQLDIDDKNDHIIAARVHTVHLNGIAAEVSLEKAVTAGAEPKEVALLLARAFLLQGKFNRAEKVLEDTVLLEDDAYEALLIRGDISKEGGNIGDARTFYEAAIQDKPESARGYIGLALLELYAGNLDEAAKWSVAAEERSGPDPIVYYVRGATARYQQDPETAKHYLNQAIDLHQAHIMAHLELVGIHVEEGDIEAAEKSLDSAFGINAEHSMALYYSALILASKGEVDKAEEILLRIGDLTRDYPPATRVYGHVAYQLEKFTTATPYLKKFLEIIPSDRITRLALAESLTRRGRGRQALEYLRPLIFDGSTDLEAFLQASAAAGLLGEVAQARGYLAAAEGLAAGTELDQQLVKSLSRRHALARFMTGEAEQALAQLRSMYETDEEDFVSLTLLANMQMQSGDIAGAEASANKLIEFAPENPLGPNILGSVRYRQRQPVEAIQLYNAALALNSGYVSALKNRALAYLAIDKNEEAKADLEFVLKKVPNDVHARGMLGRALLLVGDAREAVPHLQRAADVYPQSAIIATDYSQALAAMNYTSSAISKAQEARRLAGNDAGLVKYIDGLLEVWQAVLVEEKLQKEAQAEERRKARAEEAKRKAEEAAKKAAEEAEKAAEDAEDEGEGDEPPVEPVEPEPVEPEPVEPEPVEPEPVEPASSSF